MYELALIRGSAMWIAQGDNETRMRSGDLVLWNTSRPFDGRGLPGGVSRAVILHLPVAELPLHHRRLDRLLASSAPARGGVGGVLAAFLRGVVRRRRPSPSTRPSGSASRHASWPSPSSRTGSASRTGCRRSRATGCCSPASTRTSRRTSATRTCRPRRSRPGTTSRCAPCTGSSTVNSAVVSRRWSAGAA
ncbi:hypothetical protein ACFQ0M_06315 [Kitasatospora aburaviensis]